MRALLQRVTRAEVWIEGQCTSAIDNGWLTFIGISATDQDQDLDYISDKILNLRGFSDNEGRLDLSVRDVGGSILIVSQFTLYGDCRKGRRPSFTEAARPDSARYIYNRFVEKIKDRYQQIQTGEFQAMMQVKLINDGPVTFLLNSKKEDSNAC